MNRLARVIGIASGATALAAVALASAPAAAADGIEDVTPRDSWGLSIFDYRLSFNNGAGILGPIFTADTTGPATFAYVMFAIFLPAAAIGFMALKILLKADWLTPLVKVIDGTANRLYEQIGLPFTLAVVTATLMITGAVFALRNKGNQLWHHTAVTVVCVVVGASIAFPVAEAAKYLGMGRDAAVGLGQSVTGGTLTNPGPQADKGAKDPNAANDPTAVLVDEWVRKPIQRWTFGGQDLDSIGCGDFWTARVKAGDADKIKDAPIDCLGPEAGKSLHDAAMNPQNTLVFSVLTTIFGLILCLMLVRVVVSVLGVSVVALIHAGLVKIGMMGAGTNGGQNFLIRNGVDAPVAACMFFAGLLGVYVSAAVAKILAQVVPSSTTGMMLIILLLAATGLGIRKVIRNLKLAPARAARALTNGSGSGSGQQTSLRRSALGTASRVVATATAARYAAQRTRRAVAAVAGPEAAIPSAVASKVRAAAQRARGGVGASSGSAATRAATTGTQSAGGYSPAGGGVGAPAMSPAQYARIMATQYRSSRSTMYTPAVGGQQRTVAGRGQQARAMAMTGAQSTAGYAADRTPAGASIGGAADRSAPRQAGSGDPAQGATRSRGSGSGASGTRSSGGTASAARNVARTYRDRNRS